MNTENANNTKSVIISKLGAVLIAAATVFSSTGTALAAPTVQGVTLNVEQITVKSSPAVNTPHGQVYFPVQLKATKQSTMYAEANAGAAVLSFIPESTLMTGTGKTGDFYAATLPHGLAGYIPVGDVVIMQNYYGSHNATAGMGATNGISTGEAAREQEQPADDQTYTGDDLLIVPAPELWAGDRQTSLAEIAASGGKMNPMPAPIKSSMAEARQQEVSSTEQVPRDEIITELGDRFQFTVNSTNPALVDAVSYIIYPAGGTVSSPVLEGRIRVTARDGNTATAIGDIDTRSIQRGSYTIIFWTETEKYTTQDNASTRSSESTHSQVYHTKSITCGVDSPDPEYVSVDRATANIRCIAADGTKLFSDKGMTQHAATLNYADVVELIHDSGSVSKIYVDNKAYFLPTSSIMTVATLKAKTPSKAYAAGAVEWGLLQRGSAYVLGGNGDSLQIAGRGVYDCSGLIWRCYRTGGGLNWDRTTAAGQLVHSKFTTIWSHKNGPEYDKQGFIKAYSSLKPGDLVAFQTATNSDRLNNVTHIGLYLGNNRMVHAGEPVHVEYMGDYSLHVGDTKYGKIRGIARVK